MILHYVIECEEPGTGIMGCYVHTGESHRGMNARRVSPIFQCNMLMHQWVVGKGWKVTKSFTIDTQGNNDP